jgi:hypothetical protein
MARRLEQIFNAYVREYISQRATQPVKR